MKKYFPIVLFIMGFAGFLCGQVAFDLFNQAKQQKIVHPKEKNYYERLYSKISFKDTKGLDIKLSEVSSPLIILNFWASWCTPCLEEFPSMVDLRKRFSEKDLFILGINSDEENQMLQIEKITKKYKLNFPTVADPAGDIFNKFNIASIPFTIVFYKGKVVEVVKGPKDFSSIEVREDFKKLITTAGID